MKNLYRLFAVLIVFLCFASCTPQEMLTEESNSTNPDTYATGGDTHGGTNDDRDDDGE